MSCGRPPPEATPTKHVGQLVPLGELSQTGNAQTHCNRGTRGKASLSKSKAEAPLPQAAAHSVPPVESAELTHVGQRHGRPPETWIKGLNKARMQHLLALQAQLQGRLRDKLCADPSHEEMVDAAVTAIDDIRDLLYIPECTVTISHIEGCIRLAERLLSSLPGSRPAGSPVG